MSLPSTQLEVEREVTNSWRWHSSSEMTWQKPKDKENFYSFEKSAQWFFPSQAELGEWISCTLKQMELFAGWDPHFREASALHVALGSSPLLGGRESLTWPHYGVWKKRSVTGGGGALTKDWLSAIFIIIADWVGGGTRQTEKDIFIFYVVRNLIFFPLPP